MSFPRGSLPPSATRQLGAYPRRVFLGALTTQQTAAAAAAAVASGGANVGADITAVLGIIQSAFSGSSYDATHQQILAWSQTILADPGFATLAAQNAWLLLRCWSGDQTVITPANTAYLFGGGNVAQGCGCEVAHGCRADAQQAVAAIKAAIPGLLTGPLSSSPYTNPNTGLPVTTPNGGAPPYQSPYVPASSPTMLLLGAGLVLALALSGGRR